jgi:hypothetical protein
VKAVEQIADRRLTDLSLREKPIALQTSVIANSNRDTKRQRKPYSIDDFTIFKTAAELNLPSKMNAAAAHAAIKAGLMPTWALFIYPDLAAAYDENVVPDSVILVAEDAILINPRKQKDGFKGLLVARESSSMQSRLFKDENGQEHWLKMPHVKTKVIAEENMELASCRPLA